MKVKNIILVVLGLLLLNCKNENTIQKEEIVQVEHINIFEIINKSFEERLNQFIDGCERMKDQRNKEITVGSILVHIDKEGKIMDNVITFSFYKPTSCENIIGLKKVKGYTIFYASLGEDIDKQIIKINKPFNDCLKYVDLGTDNSFYFGMSYLFEKGELKTF